MTADASMETYRQLTHKERAALAFRYLVAIDEAELARLDESASNSKEYASWREQIFAMASYWSITHWRMRCHREERLRVLMMGVRRGKNGEKALEAIREDDSVLLALDAALDQVCTEHGIDTAAVRRMGETGSFRPLASSTAVNEQCLAIFRGELELILSEEHGTFKNH